MVSVLGVCAVLTACSGPRSTDETAESGSSAGGSSTASKEARAILPELEPVFGSQVAAREQGSFGLDRWTLVDTGSTTPNGPALRVSYPAGSVSPSATREYGYPGGGMQVYLEVVDGRPDEAYLRYWVRLPEDFEFVKGGKLPGLYGGTEVSGGEEPDGTDGFSTRLMWRTDGEGEVYLYAPDESGTSLGRGDWTWPRGAWTCVEQHVVLNEPDADDGSVTVWIDGVEVFSEDGMRYRTVEDLRIDGIFFSTFFGGADPSWAPSFDQYADFAGFMLSDERIGCS
jgi:hypothetical protein